MKIRLPQTVEVSIHEVDTTSVRLTLDDGRTMRVSGTGHVTVYAPGRVLGSEDYSLDLPTTEWVGEHCDNPSGDYTRTGHATIEVEHRH